MGQTFSISLNPSENTDLVVLYAAGSNQKNVAVSNAQLQTTSPATHKLLNAVFKAVTGTDLTPEDNSILANFKQGAFRRFYGPYVCQNEGNPGIQWGSTFIPFTISKGIKLAPQLANAEIEVSSEWVNTTGLGNELALKVTVIFQHSEEESDYTMITQYFSLSAEDPINNPFKEQDKDLLDLAVKRDPKPLVERLSAPKGGYESSVAIKLAQLVQGETYTVIGYETPENISPLCELQHNPDSGYHPTLEDGKTVDYESVVPLAADCKIKLWANYTISRTLDASPVITEDMPAMLTAVSRKQTKNGNTSVNVLFQLHPDSVKALSDNQAAVPDFDI
jgi:hypothetical protein